MRQATNIGVNAVEEVINSAKETTHSILEAVPTSISGAAAPASGNEDAKGRCIQLLYSLLFNILDLESCLHRHNIVNRRKCGQSL